MWENTDQKYSDPNTDVFTQCIYQGILALDASKATDSDDMPTKIIKNDSDIFSKFFQANLKGTLTEVCQFSASMSRRASSGGGGGGGGGEWGPGCPDPCPFAIQSNLCPQILKPI